MKNRIWLWHNNDTRQDAYGGWNFTIDSWDADGPLALWWSVNSTTLMKSKVYRLAEQSVETVNIKVEPSRKVYIGKNATKSILGFNIAWMDVEEQKVTYQPVEHKDTDHNTHLGTNFNSTDITINLNMYFVESQYIIKTYSWSDIFQTLGGLFSTLQIFATPVGYIFVVYFLLLLVQIVKDQIRLSYINRLKLFLSDCKHQYFPKIIEEMTCGNVDLSQKTLKLIGNMKLLTTNDTTL